MAGSMLICAATARELAASGFPATPSGTPSAAPGMGNPSFVASDSRGRIFAVTGVGIPMTMARLLPLILRHKPSLLINIGIAGAYPGSGLAVGDVVIGESEIFGDLGMESPGAERFQPLGPMPWADPEYREPLKLVAGPFGAPPVPEHRPLPIPKTGKGCTVNACTGRAETGELRRRLFGADFESMEGAAVALAGLLHGIPVAEVRAISNIAADRDMRPENVTLALGNLGVYLSVRLGEAG